MVGGSTGGLQYLRPILGTNDSSALNTALMIQQIRKPLTPPPTSSPKPTVIYRPTLNASTQQIILQQVPSPVSEPMSSLPTSTGVKTVMKTTLMPRSSTFSESQINSILKGMVPEPPSSLSIISSQDKEKAQAIAATAVSNFEAQVAADPLPQPLELPEAGPLPSAGELHSLEDNVLLPELPENFVEKLQQRSKEKSELRQVCSRICWYNIMDI